MSGLPNLAVALDVARSLAEDVLNEDAPKRTRIAAACAHAELALEVWRETIDVTLLPTRQATSC